MFSDLPSKADIDRRDGHVRFVPCVDGSELARLFCTLAGWSVQPWFLRQGLIWVDRDPRWGSHFLQGFPCKPHIRRELIPATVPHSGRGELQENGTTLCRRRCSAMPNNGDVSSDHRTALRA